MLTRPLAVAVLAIGVLAISTGAIFVVAAHEVPAISKAAWRTSIAGGILLVLISANPRHRMALAALEPRDRLHIMGSGLALATHFALWIPSLDFTSVSSSVVLVTLGPLFVAVMSQRVLGEAVAGATWRGIGLAILGSLCVGWGDAAFGRKALLGDAMAIAGAVAAAIYFLFGRLLRSRLGLIPYIGAVYSIAGACLVGLALVRGDELVGFGPRAWTLLVLLAIVPQVIGHGSLNWALASLSAAFVSIVTLGEPIMSSGMAWLFFGQVPTPRTLAGRLLILAGLLVAARGEGKKPRIAPTNDEA